METLCREQGHIPDRRPGGIEECAAPSASFRAGRRDVSVHPGRTPSRSAESGSFAQPMGCRSDGRRGQAARTGMPAGSSGCAALMDPRQRFGKVCLQKGERAPRCRTCATDQHIVPSGQPSIIKQFSGGGPKPALRPVAGDSISDFLGTSVSDTHGSRAVVARAALRFVAARLMRIRTGPGNHCSSNMCLPL